MTPRKSCWLSRPRACCLRSRRARLRRGSAAAARSKTRPTSAPPIPTRPTRAMPPDPGTADPKATRARMRAPATRRGDAAGAADAAGASRGRQRRSGSMLTPASPGATSRRSGCRFAGLSHGDGRAAMRLTALPYFPISTPWPISAPWQNFHHHPARSDAAQALAARRARRRRAAPAGRRHAGDDVRGARASASPPCRSACRGASSCSTSPTRTRSRSRSPRQPGDRVARLRDAPARGRLPVDPRRPRRDRAARRASRCATSTATASRSELDAEGLLATAIQHEINHLDGKLIIDFLSPLKRDMVVRKFKKQARATEAL